MLACDTAGSTEGALVRAGIKESCHGGECTPGRSGLAELEPLGNWGDREEGQRQRATRPECAGLPPPCGGKSVLLERRKMRG